MVGKLCTLYNKFSEAFFLLFIPLAYLFLMLILSEYWYKGSWFICKTCISSSNFTWFYHKTTISNQKTTFIHSQLQISTWKTISRQPKTRISKWNSIFRHYESQISSWNIIFIQEEGHFSKNIVFSHKTKVWTRTDKLLINPIRLGKFNNAEYTNFMNHTRWTIQSR